MKESLYFTTLYKSDDKTMTVYQGKDKETVLIYSSFYTSVTVVNTIKVISESVKDFSRKPNILYCISTLR